MVRTAGLVVGMAALWGCTCWPAYRMAGRTGVSGSAAAALICTVPAALTLAAGRWALTRSSGLFNAIVLGGIPFRMLAVLLVGGMVELAVPEFQRNAGSFLIWLVGFYLISLALEMVLLLSGRPSRP